MQAVNMADTQNLEKMKVAELKKLCKEKGVPCSGNKGQLLARLQGAVWSETDFGSAADDDDDDVGDDILNEDDEVEVKDASHITTDEADILGDKDTELEPAEPAAKTVPEKPTSPAAKPAPKPEAPAVAKAKSPEKPAAEESAAEGATKKISLKKIEFPESTETKTTTTPGEVKILTEAERIARRASKFGVQSEDKRKEARLQRFGGSPSETNGTKKSMSASSIKTNVPDKDTPEEIEKLKKRAERFGTVVAPTLSKIDAKERLTKRKERFGISTSGGEVVGSSTDEAKKRRLERFNQP